MRNILVFAVFVCLSLAGCQSNLPKHSEQLQNELKQASESKSKQKKLTSVPASVRQDLLPVLPESSVVGEAMVNEQRYRIDADEVDAKAFFANLVSGSDYSVVIHPNVSGAITLSLKDVTLHEIMELAEDIYGYDIEKRGQVYRIMPAGMRTETFAVNYLHLQRDGSSSTTITTGSVSDNQGGSSNSNSNNSGNNQSNNQQNNQNQQGLTSSSGTNISTENKTDFWKEIKENLESLIGNSEGRRVMVSPQAGLVVVRAFPDEIRAVKDYLHQAEVILTRQVVLEAKIIEVVLNDQYQQGINWTQAFDDTLDSSLGVAFSGAVSQNAISSGLGGLVSLVVSDTSSDGNGSFDGVINLLETQGNVQVLSNPRLTASNNQKAVIKVGNDEYFVTDVSTTTVTGTATSTTPNIGLTPFFSGIALDVTPQIDDQGKVILHIHPSVIDTNEQEKVISLNGSSFSLPLAQSNIRESDTVIQAQSGEVVVIGGLMQSTITDENSKVPLLGDIPFVGNLFTNKNQLEQKKELVILLKPTVVGEGTWKEEIERSSDLLENWYSSDNKN